MTRTAPLPHPEFMSCQGNITRIVRYPGPESGATLPHSQAARAIGWGAWRAGRILAGRAWAGPRCGPIIVNRPNVNPLDCNIGIDTGQGLHCQEITLGLPKTG
jgi:hypothetical protein